MSRGGPGNVSSFPNRFAQPRAVTAQLREDHHQSGEPVPMMSAGLFKAPPPPKRSVPMSWSVRPRLGRLVTSRISAGRQAFSGAPGTAPRKPKTGGPMDSVRRCWQDAGSSSQKLTDSGRAIPEGHGFWNGVAVQSGQLGRPAMPTFTPDFTPISHTEGRRRCQLEQGVAPGVGPRFARVRVRPR